MTLNCVSGKWWCEVMLFMTFLQQRIALLNYCAAGFSWRSRWAVCWKWAGDEMQYQACAVRSCFHSLSPSFHPSPLTWGIPLFATRSLHRWLKLGDREIIRAWAVLTLDSSCVLVSPLSTSFRGQTTERTLREHSICFLSYWLFIFRSVECIMNGFSARREWEMISLALGDREDMSKRCSGGLTRTTGRHVWRWGLRCGTRALPVQNVVG